MAVFIEDNPEKADVIDWSSVTQKTGVGMFAMWTDKPELLSQFRALLRSLMHDKYEFESFPKDTLLESYAITIYAHKQTLPFKTKTFMEQFRRSQRDMEVVEVKEFPLDHEAKRKQGIRDLFYPRRPRILGFAI